MKQHTSKIIGIVFLLLSINVYALSLSDDAIERGISETCASYLNQVEKSYNLSGLNITFANPEKKISPVSSLSIPISSSKLAPAQKVLSPLDLMMITFASLFLLSSVILSASFFNIFPGRELLSG